MKILYLSEWYPHRYDAMSGLFVRKHAAAAVRAGVDVCVLYFLKDGKAKNGLEIVDQTSDGVREIYIYHSTNWLQAMRKGWKEVEQRWGKPDLTQLNVLTKNGLLAYWLKQRYGIPYILVEHWSGYLPENNSFKGGMHGWLMQQIAAEASCILPVSQALEKAMKARGIRAKKWSRINNVVDDFFFEETQHSDSRETFRFLHVSCFDERSKNTLGILEAVDRLRKERTDFELVMIGTGPDFRQTKEASDRLGLTKRYVFFRGEQPPEAVQQAMTASDCFVLFSRYENAPVVLSESMAAGLPIIATKAGGMPEMVNATNGLLVDSGDTEALKEAMSRMMDAVGAYDKAAIREMGKAYSEEAVGQLLKDTYAKVLASGNR